MQLSPVQFRILEIIKISGPKTAKELKEMHDNDAFTFPVVIPRRLLNRKLKALVDDGQLEMVGGGNKYAYQIPVEPIKKLPRLSFDPIVAKMRAWHKKHKCKWAIGGCACGEDR